MPLVVQNLVSSLTIGVKSVVVIVYFYFFVFGLFEIRGKERKKVKKRNERKIYCAQNMIFYFPLTFFL